MRFESAAHVSVLVFSHAVGNGVVTDVTSVLSVFDFLHKVVLTSSIDVVVALDLVRKALSSNGLKLESLDELILGSVAFSGNLNLADVGTTVEFANDERVAGNAGVVGVVVVLAIVCGFKVVTTVEELGYVSSTGALNNEFATGMVGSVISAVEDKVIEEEKVASALAGNSVEFFFSDDSERSHELDVLSEEHLVANFKHDHRDNEGYGGDNPKVVPLHAVTVVGVDTCGNTVDCNEDHQPGEVLVKITESHQESSTRSCLPSAEVGNKSGNHERNGHEGNGHGSKGVKVFAGATFIFCADELTIRVRVDIPAFLLVDGPEAPEHSGERNERSKGGVEDHVGLPFVAHVTCGGDLDDNEDVPAEEVDVTVSEEHGE